ncbi:threonine aldolase [Pelagibius litoralis]|uniref:Threonine aldolase n=1 Tax=Pelagibius litoralis TaxID=374515 RepID=A0A967EVS3_9PROT|nr:beta-eliminating lyase-related protein [Pelagibius litoralis]NIA68269.1 threonine aldolase [Pelagibius litoralis]
MDTLRDKESLRRSCSRFLSHDSPVNPRRALAELADFLPEEAEADFYGSGKLIEDFEQRIAEILGKPAAVFGPSGKMLQNAALRVWADRQRCPTVALHPQCHIFAEESEAYQRIFGLQAATLGAPDRLATPADLEAIVEPLGAIALELPLRRLGCRLHPWSDIEGFAAIAKTRGIALHADAARIWESQPFYGLSLAEIAAPFDSLYVSFYKGLGGFAGGALAGPKDIVDEVRVWQQRCGGRLIHLFPYVAAAMKGLEERLPRMAAYHEKTKAIARALSALPGVWVMPEPPHANAVLVTVETGGADLMEAALDVAEESGLWLTTMPPVYRIEGLGTFEITVREGAMTLSDEEIVEGIRALQRALARRNTTGKVA